MTEAEDDGELFSRFLELGRDFEGPGRGISPIQSQRALDFAQRYGTIVLCSDHSQPVMHCPGEHRAGAKTGRWPPVRELMDLSYQLRTVLKVAVQLEKDEAPSWEDCLTILRVQNPDIVNSSKPYETGRQALKAALARDEGHAESWLSRAVNQWIRHGELRPHLEWTAGGPKRVELNVRSLLGSLARHVFVTVTGEVGLAICDGCSQLFVPQNRKPKAGQLTWCYDCGEGSNYRAAKRVSARMRRRE